MSAPAVEPGMLRQLRITEVARLPARGGGVTPEVLFVGALLAFPALYSGIVQGDIPLYLMLERYVIIVFGVLMISQPLHWVAQGGRTQPRLFDPKPGHPDHDPRERAAAASRERNRSGGGFGAPGSLDDLDAPDLDAPSPFDDFAGASPLDRPGLFDAPDFDAPLVLGPDPDEALGDEIFGDSMFDAPEPRKN